VGNTHPTDVPKPCDIMIIIPLSSQMLLPTSSFYFLLSVFAKFKNIKKGVIIC
jgi:hypothetical protein